MIDKHTATPYTISTITSHRLAVVMAGPLVIADCRSVDTAVGNAKFIVRACNAHDELVDCLKLARSMLVARGNMQIGDLDEIEQALTKAKANPT